MAPLLEVLFQGIFEVVFYGVGRAVLMVFAPHYGVESQAKAPKSPWWKWRGFSFEYRGKRYVYDEAVQVIGLAVIVVLVVLGVLANTYLK